MSITVQLELPEDQRRFHLPEAVDNRLQSLLDRQDRGISLSSEERAEAEGVVNLSELLSLLRLRAERFHQTDDES